jgi:hypothetical protein
MTIVLEDAKPISIRKFGTLNTATEETKLPVGDSPNMSNVWTDEAPGSVQTAKGYVLAGTAPSGNPIRFLFNFKKDDGTQLAIVSDNATVWTTRDFQTFTSIITGLSASFQLRACTARGKVWFTNGNDSVRTYNGTTVVALDGTAGTPNVPKGKYVTYYHERVWVYNISAKRSTARFTALTDSSGTEITPDDANAWTATNEIKIGDGDGDFGTGMFLYNQKLHFFKTKSIWRMEGIDEFSYFPFKTRAEIGPRIQENVVLLDSLMQFVSIGGFYTFDGDGIERISDILNPTSGLGNLSVSDIQSPDTNQSFWIQDVAADFDAGIKSANINDSSNDLVLKPADDSTADFDAGPERTRIDTASDQIQISKVNNSSVSLPTNVCLGSTIAGDADFFDAPVNQVIDGNISTYGTMRGCRSLSITFPSLKTLNKIIVRNYRSFVLAGVGVAQDGTLQYQNTAQTWITIGTLTGALGTPGATQTFLLTPILAMGIRFIGPGGTYGLSIAECEAYEPGFETTGKFVSKTLDLQEIPSSLGKLQADYDLNGGAASFFTQSSVDNSTWDSEIALAAGGAIASTPHRYFRWGVNLSANSGQTDSPAIRKVYGPGLFISQTFDTTSTIFQWKAYQSNEGAVGGTVLHFYRTATTTGGLAAKSWTAITLGSDIVSAVTDTCVQFKIEMSSGDAAREPSVDSVTINWITGTEGAISSEQLVHGIAWNGRYWVDVSELGQAANNLMLIRGRKTFNSPWQLKRDWRMLALFIFNDALYGGSSTDSKIYKLDTGYSANGSALDSFFETGDMVGDEPDFEKNILQIIIDYELMGSNADYNLSAGVSIDRGVTWLERTANLLGTGRTTKALNLFRQEHQFRFRFRTNGIDQPFIAHGLDALYRPTKFR